MEEERQTDGVSSENPAIDRLATLIRDWRVLASRVMEEAEEFAKEKPGVALSSSFFLGFLFGRVFGRR